MNTLDEKKSKYENLYKNQQNEEQKLSPRSKITPVEKKLEDIKDIFDLRWEMREGFTLMRKEMKDGFNEMRDGFNEMRDGFNEMRDGFNEMRERFDRINNNLSLMVCLALAKSDYIDEKYKSDFNKRLASQIVKFVNNLDKSDSAEDKKNKITHISKIENENNISLKKSESHKNIQSPSINSNPQINKNPIKKKFSFTKRQKPANTNQNNNSSIEQLKSRVDSKIY